MRSPDPLVVDLASARRARGWSQEHLGNACGLTQATISRVECGARQPNLSTLRLLADALGFDVELCPRLVSDG